MDRSISCRLMTDSCHALNFNNHVQSRASLGDQALLCDPHKVPSPLDVLLEQKIFLLVTSLGTSITTPLNGLILGKWLKTIGMELSRFLPNCPFICNRYVGCLSPMTVGCSQLVATIIFAVCSRPMKCSKTPEMSQGRSLLQT